MKFSKILLAAVTISLAMGSAASAAETEKKKGGGLSYIQLPALTATIVRPTGRRGVLTVEVGLDVPDTKLRDRAAASTPRLRDAYVRFIQTYAASIPAGGIPNPDSIGSALQRSTDQVLAQPGARLLLGTIMVN